jgi:hypothetical protein
MTLDDGVNMEEALVPNHLQFRVESELEDGERVVWMDMPVASYFTPWSTTSLCFGIPWTVFTIVFMVVVGKNSSVSFADGLQMDDLFPLFGLPFLIVGCLMLSSPIWARRQALNTVYVITDRRAISIEGMFTVTVRSYSPRQLGALCRRERRNGTGDVIIEQTFWRDSDNQSHSLPRGFMRIREPKKVETLLKRLASQGAAGVPAV